MARPLPYIDMNGQPILEWAYVKQQLIDEVQPPGYFWWVAQVRFVRGCYVVMQLGFDYSKSPWEDYTLLHDCAHDLEVITHQEALKLKHDQGIEEHAGD